MATANFTGFLQLPVILGSFMTPNKVVLPVPLSAAPAQPSTTAYLARNPTSWQSEENALLNAAMESSKENNNVMTVTK